MIVKGQRLPSPAFLDAVVKVGRLTPKERRYLELLVRKERLRRSGKRDEALEAELTELLPVAPGVKRTVMTRAMTEYVSEWHHLVIKQLVAAPGFQEDLAKMRQRLRSKVSTLQIRRAIETLLKLGIFERDGKSGKLRLRRAEQLVTTMDVPVRAIRRHHKEMMQRAAEALEEQTVEEREFYTLTTRIRASRLAEAKKAIREFRDWFDRRFESSDASEVYQLNVQFFRHTTGADIA